ncbi:hypothetical protein [Geodermatophilus sp. CPCC 206100]|uniref:hypothetical protein n=1 Tax=Geodermatophilus sp. CPCC 206100 TaxID=3020054 RepID=UPI003AFF9ECB
MSRQHDGSGTADPRHRPVVLEVGAPRPRPRPRRAPTVLGAVTVAGTLALSCAAGAAAGLEIVGLG